ncbi:putative uncharacterized protein [Clostridium sp. CAG:356]|jgi:putative uncharacterized protein DDB_G0282499|nr:putative uncharacterized protein [Clostridium sp. CAG:356]
MSNNINDLFANLNVPDDVKQMINNGSSNDLNNLLSQVSPEMINNLSNILNSNAQTSSQNSSNQNINNSTPNNNNNFNLDMNTIMKMKSIMENMNNKNDPRANLLYSLKPYLRDSKKDKLDQYVNLLNVSKIAELMNKNNDNKKE